MDRDYEKTVTVFDHPKSKEIFLLLNRKSKEKSKEIFFLHFLYFSQNILPLVQSLHTTKKSLASSSVLPVRYL